MEFSASRSATTAPPSRAADASSATSQETGGESEFAVTLDAILAAPAPPPAKAKPSGLPTKSQSPASEEPTNDSDASDADAPQTAAVPATVLAQVLTTFQAAVAAPPVTPCVKLDSPTTCLPQTNALDLESVTPSQVSQGIPSIEGAGTPKPAGPTSVDPLTVSPDNTVLMTVTPETPEQAAPTLVSEQVLKDDATGADKQPTLIDVQKVPGAHTSISMEVKSVPQPLATTEVPQQVSAGTAPEAQPPGFEFAVPTTDQQTISKPAAPAAPAAHRLPAAALEGVQATVVRPETTGSTDRSAATQRPTMTLTMREVSVISAFGGEALEGEAAGSGSSSEEFGQDLKRHTSGASSSNASGPERGGPALSGPSEFSRELKTAAASPQPLDVEERMRVVEQVRRKIDALHLTNGRHEATLRLNPEHLGEVRLNILSERNQVTAQFMAETAQARQAMTEGREQLRASLEQKGFTLQSLEVSTLKPGDGDSARSAMSQTMQNFNLSTNSGGDRRSGSSSFGRRTANQTSDADRAVESIPALTESAPTRRPNGRLDYRV